ncbi:hypothetical protein BGX29_004658 [Mortierella sp. GBA35]|nr:hypothetical protein BGX29_004658 [Mortierella sp. GBA35]
MNAETIYSIFAHLPTLESLTVPPMRMRKDDGPVADFFVKHCPKIRRLLHDDNLGDSPRDGVMLNIIAAKPENTIESLCYGGSSEGIELYDESFLGRHMESLKEVRLTGCRVVHGRSIAILLSSTPVLGSLIVDGNTLSHHTIAVDVGYLGLDWASTRLREFQMVINMSDLTLSRLDFFRSPLAPEDCQTTRQFEWLLRNLGKQTDL